jgi:arabinofuranosyltransferase
MTYRLGSSRFLALVMAAPVVFFAVAAWSRRWMSDDGYIYLRVVRQLLDGNGPVYNHGERVEATTGPLWVGLLSIAKEIARPVSLPWLAVVLGLLLSVAGLALAQRAAQRLWSRGERRFLLPLGAVVIAALPPFWDFATSGLETGLSFAWLGASFWALSREATNGGEPRISNLELLRSGWPFVLAGLGPLIRPDFALYSIAFLAALVLVQPSMTLRARIRSLALAVALPLAYEVFRMGYYGALVPNPAFAKEASAARLGQGWYYLVDAFHPYWLFVPLVLVALAALPAALRRRRDRSARIVIGATMIAALAHGGYVVYVGGDFMHTRMLLPAIFGLLMPFAVIEIDDARALVPALGVVAWAIVCAAVLRPSYDGIGPHGIANEREYYVNLSLHGNPITPADYAGYPGEALAEIDAVLLARRSGLLLGDAEAPLPLRADTPAERVVTTNSIGVFGYVLDDNVYVVDTYGLADPLAGRLELKKRGRPGHEKVLPDAWIVARFADPSAPLPAGGPAADDVAAARDALGCGDIPELLGAAADPLTPGRFAHNLVDAFRLHRFRIPPQPIAARDKLC